MKTGTIVLLALGGYALYAISQFSTGVNTVQIVFNGIQAQSPLNYSLNFLVQNVSNAAATLRALTGSINVNGQTVGNLSYFPNQPISIGPASQQQIVIPLQLSVLGLGAELASLLTQNGGSQPLTFTVTGNMNVDSFVIPFTVQNTVTLP